jgi:hypothetical protein
VLAAMWQLRFERRKWRAPIGLCAATLGIAALTLWGVYRFKIGPLDNSDLIVPAPSYWGEWLALAEYLATPLPAYLFGQVSARGWWYYYPVTWVLKTPLPVLMLLGLAIGLMIVRRTWLKNMPVLLPPALLLLTLLFSPHDLGYRYLLPMLPFIFVACADVFAAARRKRWATVGVLALVVWQIVGTLRIYPYYFAFFNEAAGGPERGRYLLSDSNLDLGQDLVGLKAYVAQEHIVDLNLSYFGNTDPAVYDLHTYALPPVRSAMHQQGAWWLHRYYPRDPAPGQYAISVANLMGGLWNDPSEYTFFRERLPEAVIGHSIYLYTIEPRGEPVDLSLAGLQIDQIDPETYRLFETNAVRPRWFEATSSLIAAPGPTWMALADDQPIAPEFKPLFEGVEPIKHVKLTDEDRSYALYHFDLAQRLTDAAQQATPSAVQFGDTAALLGYALQRDQQAMTLTTYWRAGDQVITPLQMFVHVLGPDGSIVAQQDRLDVPAYGWRSGDVIAQVHRLQLPAAEADWHTVIGLYNTASGARLPVTANGLPAGDHWVVGQAKP